MSAPLYNEIMKYKKNTTSFHMPGHKFGSIFKMKDIALLELDVTEVEGLDNLYEAEGIIRDAQNMMAKKYEAKDTIFVTNGSTSGIIASILTICSPGDSLIVARNCHHSVWNALILGGIRPIYINPTYHKEYNILGGICPFELEETLKQHPEAKGLILVSPSYEGLVSDIESIANILDQHNKILIVDEAHGAHFVWDHCFPQSAVRLGADLVVQSMHKTLPALTQSALIHIGTHKVDKYRLTNRLQMTQTSSPSYVMMGMMDYVRDQMENQAGLWELYTEHLFKTRARLSKMKNLFLLPKDICGTSNIYDIDQSKLVIFTYKTNITGIELGQILRKKYKIQVEVESEEYIIAMSTIGDQAEDLDLLSKALMDIDGRIQEDLTHKRHYRKIQMENSKVSPREIFYADKEKIKIEESLGRKSGTNLMLYPPGIPLICIGEVFSQEIIDYIRSVSDQVLGMIKEENIMKVWVSKES